MTPKNDWENKILSRIKFVATSVIHKTWLFIQISAASNPTLILQYPGNVVLLKLQIFTKGHLRKSHWLPMLLFEFCIHVYASSNYCSITFLIWCTKKFYLILSIVNHGCALFIIKSFEIERISIAFCERRVDFREWSILESISLLSPSIAIYNVKPHRIALLANSIIWKCACSSAHSKLIDETCSIFLQQFETNNPKTNNYGTLIQVFIRLAAAVREDCAE